MSAVVEKVKQLISDIMQCPVEEISLETTSRDVAMWDSMNHLNLVMAIEQEYRVRFTPDEIQRMLSVQAILDEIGKRLPK